MMMRATLLLAIVAGTAYAGDADDVAKVVDDQIVKMQDGDAAFVPSAPVFSSNVRQTASLDGIVWAPNTGASNTTRDRLVTMSRDGKSAWVSELERVDIVSDKGHAGTTEWRVSELVVKTAAGWRIHTAVWTRGVPDAKVNKDAKAGKMKDAGFQLGDTPGDASLRAAFAKLVSDGLDATAAARKDLVALGTAPGERTMGGAIHAKAWAAWKGKAKVTESVAGVAPSGTTGWVGANVEVDKGGYKIPFFVFCVFDKTAKGAWSVVHSHFAVE
jgi:ketosteroid isomerase-like protein